VLAGAAMSCWKQTAVLNRRREAGIIVAHWYQATVSTLDYLRTLNRDVPDVEHYPREIEQLLKIAHGD